MNVFVNILKILIIIVFIGIAVVLVAFGALVLFPGFSLFGLHYITGDSKVVGLEYDLKTNSEEWQTVDTVWIKTNAWDIEVHPKTAQEDNIYLEDCLNVRWSHLYNGFVYGEVQEPSLSEPTVVTVGNDNRLLFEVKEPDGGWLSKTDTLIKLYYDANDFAGKNLLIETKSGQVTVGNDIDFTVGDLTINSDNGFVKVNQISLNGDATISKYSGDIDVNVDLPTNVMIDVSSGYGKINLQNVGTSTTALVLGFNEKIKNSNIQIGNVYGALDIKADGGLLRGGNVDGTFSANVSSCDVYLGNVGKNVTFNSVDGLLELNKTSGKVTVNSTGNGRVKIAESASDIDITTRSGEIAVGSANGNVTAVSQYGNINISGANNQITYNVKNRDGNTVLDKVKGSVVFGITNQGRGSVTINYANTNATDINDGLFGENIVSTETGAVNITVNTNERFYFKKWSTNNNVNIELSALHSTDKVNETGGGVNGASATDSNNLTVTSVTGAISVVHY